MIYVSAAFIDSEKLMVTGIDAFGASETVPYSHTLFRQPEHGPQGFEAAGGVIKPFAESEQDIPDLAPYQFRSMIRLSGKQEDIYAFIESLPEPDKTIAQSKLEYSLVFKRDNDLVLAARDAIGLTDTELDALWIQASLIA